MRFLNAFPCSFYVFLMHFEYCQFCNGSRRVETESENHGVKTYR